MRRAATRPPFAHPSCSCRPSAEAAAEAEGDTIAELMGAGDNPEMEAAVEEQTFDELSEDAKASEPEAEEAKR